MVGAAVEAARLVVADRASTVVDVVVIVCDVVGPKVARVVVSGTDDVVYTDGATVTDTFAGTEEGRNVEVSGTVPLKGADIVAFSAGAGVLVLWNEELGTGELMKEVVTGRGRRLGR